MLDHFGIEGVAGLIGDNFADEEAVIDERDSGEEVEGGAVPGGFQGFSLMEVGGGIVVVPTACDEEVFAGVAEVSDICEEPADGGAPEHFCGGGIGSGGGAIGEDVRGDGEAEALAADGGMEIEGGVDGEEGLGGIFGGGEGEEAAARVEDGDAFTDGDVAGEEGLWGGAGGLEGFHEVLGAVVKERGVTRIHTDEEAVDTQAHTEGDDVFGHTDIVMGGAGAEDDIADDVSGRPDISDGAFDGEAIGEVGSFEPPPFARGGAEGEGTFLFTEEGPGCAEGDGACDGGLGAAEVEGFGFVHSVPVDGLAFPGSGGFFGEVRVTGEDAAYGGMEHGQVFWGMELGEPTHLGRGRTIQFFGIEAQGLEGG